MKKVTLFVLMAGTIFSINCPALARQIYLDLAITLLRVIATTMGRPVTERLRRTSLEGQRTVRRSGRRGILSAETARLKTFNGCQNGWTVQDDLCKTYRY